ncbi:DUF4294 domain-containing protein [Pararcticibacter amylolyticus]|uniref:DUF4294 domain-containing protein n=1 Tax=Pararcticibacter amylolyticus TaxID=2173175 RepID=A0A2U2PK49_9SPHI|nr:DUF4294 domain-containing protein [Pararcticibacter amylolyticus]PWG81642.1 DUF4294 domain-containing protein [Pararcticibacter amylolyticus]
MKIFPFFLVLGLNFVSFAYAQDKFDPHAKGKNDTIRVAVTKDDAGEFIPWIPLADVNINNTRIFASAEDRSRYLRLRYNVLKVLPYAKYARNRYSRLHDDLALTQNKKQQKVLVKACEREIKDMFNREVKNMTISQGEILIKLVDRETGNSSYELVRQLKGGFTAFCYQSVARLFGHNLKQKYDPQQERDIENIIQQYGYYADSPYRFN